MVRARRVDRILPYNFINVVFNSSYRRVIDTGKYEDYNRINLNLESIEKEMTELLLKNKKLLNCDLILFKYNDEIFSNEINDLITNFESKYNTSDIDNGPSNDIATTDISDDPFKDFGDEVALSDDDLPF